MSELALATATLDRAVIVFANWLDWPDLPDQNSAITHALRSKVAGNGLRELDRFLNILIDALSEAQGVPSSPRQHNTANKLRALQLQLGSSRDDHARMVALGRSRACLLYCAGIVPRGDQGDAARMTLGWPGNSAAGALLRVAVGESVTMTRANFREIADFYRRLAADLAQLSCPPSWNDGFGGRQPIP